MTGPKATGRARAARPDETIIVSNRLPMTVQFDSGAVRLRPSSGGLATGLRRLRARPARPWIGWPGVALDPSSSLQRELDDQLAASVSHGVSLSEAEITGYYRRFANGLLWPLLHDQNPGGVAKPADWIDYQAVNRRFADVVLTELRAGDRVWIHDYHLMLLPRMLRQRRPDIRIAFFLHTPFPDTSVLSSCPKAGALLDGMLGADVVGFHTREYVQRFAALVSDLLGRPAQLVSGSGVVDDLGRPVTVHSCPMGIDEARFSELAADPGVLVRAAAIRRQSNPLFVGIDRLDPTKGIPERLQAFGRLLEIRPELQGHARMIQLAVPSREEIPAYRALRTRVEAMVDELNARFGNGRWKPVEYTYGTLAEPELVALYRAADIMLVTPLRDGMNLVAKEFVASRTDDAGVLVLSRQAGAASELTAALLVDPADPEALALGYAAALDMSPAERRVRMRRLRARVKAHDVHRWAAECLAQLEAVRRTPSGYREPGTAPCGPKRAMRGFP
ncbi:MAG TPA: trehalose-6-phosphate synthase [Gemmatimonadales bacterium]